MVLNPGQRVDTIPSHLHSHVDHLPPDGHHQHLHPPVLHPHLHLLRPVPDVCLRDGGQTALQILRSSSPRDGETLGQSLRVLTLVLLLLQSCSGVFVCLLDILNEMFEVDEKLLREGFKTEK